MKKYIIALSTLAILFSCDKKEKVTSEENSAEVAEIANSEEALTASYAFGVSLGKSTERYNMNLQGKDSLDVDAMLKGLEHAVKGHDKDDSYRYGLQLGNNLMNSMNIPALKGKITKEEVLKGLKDFVKNNDLKVSADSAQIVMTSFYQEQQKIAAEQKQKEDSIKAIENKKKGQEYLAKEKANLTITPSGLAYKVLQEGSGAAPTLGDKVKVKYTGKTLDGTIFDSTDINNGGEAREFVLMENGLIQGWIEGLQLMPKGAKYQFVIPSDLAYGDQSSSDKIPAGATLIFDVELVDFTEGEPQSSNTRPGVNIQAK